jgi:hypothetical protein
VDAVRMVRPRAFPVHGAERPPMGSSPGSQGVDDFLGRPSLAGGLVKSVRGERGWPGAKPVRDDRPCRPSDAWVIQSLARGTPSSSAHRRRASRITPFVERACLPFCGQKPAGSMAALHMPNSRLTSPSLGCRSDRRSHSAPPARRAAVVLFGPIFCIAETAPARFQDSLKARRESRRLRVAVPAPE